MDEREALALIADTITHAGDDAAVVEDLVVTTDMLHEETDFPPGTTRYTAGWRSVGASLSDVAAMGARPIGAVAVYAAPTFEEAELTAFLDGAVDVCEAVDTDYVGGDLDTHGEFTVASTAIGRTTDPVTRAGARPGDAVWVTGALGRSAAALEHFAAGDTDRGNELFQFTPRIDAGLQLAPHATAMLDSSDGLARSVHQVASASSVGIALESDRIPVTDALEPVVDDERERFERAITFGEDFELVGTAPLEALDDVDQPVTIVGEVRSETGVTLDGDPLPDAGYTHG